MQTRSEGDFHSGAGFEELIRRHGPRLLGLARRMGLPGVDPEDLVQEVFERAWRFRHTFRADSAVGTWLHAILLNRVRDLARRRGEDLVEDIEGVRDSGADHRNFGQAPLGPDTDDLSALLGVVADEDELRRVVHQLPLGERAAVVLHHCGGLSGEEVGRALGCSTEAARKRIQRGRLHLLSLLLQATGGHTGPRMPPPACQRARRLVGAYLDGLLDPPERVAVDEHLQTCPHCPVMVQGLMAVNAQLRTDTGHLPEHLVARIRASLRP